MQRMLVRVGLAGVFVLAHAHAARGDVAFGTFKDPPVIVKDVVATSTYADKHDAYAAWHALAYEQRDLPTPDKPDAVPIVWSAWCEGKPDEGVGETLTIHLAEPTQLDAIKIAAGVWRTDALFAANNQPTSLEVALDGKAQTVSPKGKTWVAAKVGGKVSTVAIKILAVKKGKMNDSCIAGIDLVRGGQTQGVAIGFDAKAWAALPGALREIQNAMGSPGRAALQPLLEFPFTGVDPFRGVVGYPAGVKGTSKTWKDVLAVCKEYDAASAKDSEDWVDSKGCPYPANYDPSDERGDLVTAGQPGSHELLVQFPSHKEVGIGWRLHWTDRWRLRAIEEVDFAM